MKIDLSMQEWKKILYNLKVKVDKTGLDKIFCFCPFHKDFNSSLVIYINTNKFKCYSICCNKKGDVISLISLLLP